MRFNDRVEGIQKKDWVCPYLGLRSDSGTALAYSSVSNCCFHAKPVYPIASDIQDTYCLSGDYALCEEFGRKPGQPLPDHMRAKIPRELRGKRNGWFWIVFSTFVIVLVVLLLWQFAPADFLVVPHSRATNTASLVSTNDNAKQTLTSPTATPSFFAK